jgi:hypothetical protein
MMRERYTYTVVVEPRYQRWRLEQLMEQLAAATGATYQIEASYVCDDCGTEWSENRCRPCETLGRAEGPE